VILTICPPKPSSQAQYDSTLQAKEAKHAALKEPLRYEEDDSRMSGQMLSQTWPM
jgi:hypothetical protein